LRALLDTHALLWWFLNDPQLSGRARKFLSDPANVVLVSAATAWEIATKVRIGKLPSATQLAFDLPEYIEQAGFGLLAISVEHGLRAGLLTGSHRDPFDRMLVAQAQSESMPIVSSDSAFDAFGVLRIW
jgi:PIN domain nuclease of toxin-antitoxin system